jgi:DNA topoisomerase-1
LAEKFFVNCTPEEDPPSVDKLEIENFNPMTLIIVESPTKAKTIGKFLGKGYHVLSSFGHVRDLPKSKIGIDVKNDFAPQYVIPVKAKEVIAELKKSVAMSDSVILATDEDREGEAIAWHLVQALALDGKSSKTKKTGAIGDKRLAISDWRPSRIVFHEITESAIRDALAHPREIDQHLVDAQQARRVLDRLVGYELSPFLWRKIRYGLSAGRVQSVAVRLIAEREREILAFQKEEYWTIEGKFFKEKDNRLFGARLLAIDGKNVGKFDVKKADALRITEELANAEYRVTEVSKKSLTRNPAPPFTTSTLQQEAARKLGFSAKQTMMVAQKLYEEGRITYMRTDSVNLATSALAQAQSVIKEMFGAQYALPEPRRYATKSKGAQEAHEAIRPTNLADSAPRIGDRNQARLYDLIWKRTLACQMASANVEQTAVDIAADRRSQIADRNQNAISEKRLAISDYVFRANGQTIIFDGFIRAYTEGSDEESGEEEGVLPPLAKGDALKTKGLMPLEHFTEPPPRYTDATLVKALETHGVGRPSTYAPTLSTIQERGYVEKIDKKYAPTEIGLMVNDMLVENFPEIVDINFTSHIEEELDLIAEGKIAWTEVCREFYGPFKKHLTEREATVQKEIVTSETPCPHCGKMMVVKFGRMGKFLACPDPEVKVTLPMPEEAAQIKALEEKTRGEMCPLCGKQLSVRRGRFGFFLGCVDYPKCKGIAKIWNKTGFKCPNCQALHPTPYTLTTNLIGDLVEKKSRGRGKPFYACTRYPDCTLALNKKPENEAELQELYEKWKANPPKPRKVYGKKAIGSK